MVLRLALRFLNWIGWQTLSLWALLWIALSAMIWTLADLQPGLSTSFLWPVALLGLLLGWGLATARFVPAWLAGVMLLGLGLEIVVVAVGNFEPAFLSFVERLFQLGRQSWRQPLDVTWPALVAIIGPLAELWSGLQTIGLRLLAWSSSLAWGEPLPDPMARTFAWGLAGWTVSAWAGWVIRRQLQPLVALLPAGVLLATLLAYHPRQAGNLLPFVAAALALMGLLPIIRLEQRWQTVKIDFPEMLKSEMAFAVIPIAVILFIVASFAPNVSIWRIARQVRTIFDTPVSRGNGPAPPASSAEEPPAADSNAPLALRSPGLPRSHLLGSGPELSEKVALIVHIPSAGSSSTGPRYYWRSLTYDRYSGRGWYTEETRKIDYQPQEDAITPLPHQTPLRQEIEIVRSNNTLFYAAGEITAIDQPYSIYWRGADDPFAVTGKAETYQVESFVPAGASPDALRKAGTAYPPAIRNRYLRLPDTIPQRVLTLARDLTATAPTPYDRAKAIERYVRQFPYSLDLPEPPHGRDMVDYFLFDLQSGYCDYYASSMVVLARAAGLPARLAVGYATGAYNAAEATYLVTEAEAHSWTEIYFPDYGWVKFEPTAARPSDDAQAQLEPAAPPESPADSGSVPGSRLLQAPALQVWGEFLVVIVGLLGLGILVWPAVDRWRLGRMAPARTIPLLYDRLQQAGQRLATAPHQSDTPYEYTRALIKRMNSLALNDRLHILLAPAPAAIDRLTQLYMQTIFSPHQPGNDHRSQAISAWQQLHRRLWLARLVQLWLAWRGGAAKRQSQTG